jgi:hypothetical protein
MKKIAMLLLGVSLAYMSPAQTMEKDYYNHLRGDSSRCEPCKHKRFMDGRAIFVSGSLSTFTPGYAPTTYGSSFEAGIWGTTKSFSYSVVGDFMNTIDKIDSNVLKHRTTYLGIKGYYTFYSTSTTSYMVYLAPKLCVQGNPNEKGNGLLEVGLNPNYSINKYMLLSLSLCDQIYNDDNKFDKSIWHPGISIGVVIYR